MIFLASEFRARYSVCICVRTPTHAFCKHIHTVTHTHTHTNTVSLLTPMIMSNFVLFPVLFKWKCLALLREFYGVGMDVQNKRINQTPAHLAAMASQAECISWMVQNCGISPGMQVGLTLSINLNVSDAVCFCFLSVWVVWAI